MASLILKSSDGETFNVEAKIIFCSKTIKTMFDELGHDEGEAEEEIPLPNVKGEILTKVIEWATHHKVKKEERNEIHH